ncbi:MAG: bifunctional 4-hydroxy-3-methylbut-2-enyl diphosphate reductase/30S ribosomal protein S1 [Clostridia bacterium]|nr:bifunctional 4-hydroxy-3-methylbut-2-enyl diphosphate reductase/30S ribosomal protein S1 [Clostridia bacterium]
MINVAKHAGFCFGVRRATEAVEAKLSSGKGAKVYTLGKLIHNDGYNAYLRERGVGEISAQDIPAIEERARTGEPITVVIRAHGEIKSVVERLRRLDAECENFELLDCTCPYVKKVRHIAEENSGEGKFFILIGAKEHPEVAGIMSCLRGDGAVFADSEEFGNWACGDNDENLQAKLGNLQISIAAQTTQNLNEWKKTLEIAKKVYTNALIFDTICNVTEERQTEASRLARESDVVVVIGSKSSSNTQKLYGICASLCKETYLIENAGDLSGISFPSGKKISVTAGASTPLSVIQEVEQTMNEQITENFEEMLDASMKTLNPGDVVVGVITSISQNEIHLDLGAKTTGVIVHEKLTDDPAAKLDELFKVGDEIKAKVIKVSDVEGIAMLDKTRVDSDGNWIAIVEACESGEILEGKIVDAVKGGIIATVKSVRIFIPASLSGLPRGASDDDLRALVGTTQKFKVIEVKEERKRALGSIRAVLREERKAKEAEFWAQLEVGQIYEGAVKSLTSYGAFVDLGGGVDGMVHMSELSWRRIRHPSEVVNVGDVIKVFVKGIDKEKKRISLGYKTEESDPWYIFNQKYALGDVAKVKIVSLMQFGAFAEVVPGADGLIHISQITDHKIASPAEVLHVGDEVDAKIVGIDNENRKISLSIRALIEPKEEEAPAEAAEEAAPAVFSTDNPEAYADFGVEEAPAGEAPAEEAADDKIKEVKEAISEKVAEVKEAVAEKAETAKEAIAETAAAVKEAVADKIEEIKEAVKGSDDE